MEIPGYRIDEIIGRGGMGVVYRAEHVHLRRTVALKVLAPEVAESEGFRERFVHESRVAAGIDHPSIVTVYDAGDADGLLYLAMRYVEGSDLASELREQGALALERALALLDQVGSALDAAHARGLVHRDVKPANVLLQGDLAYLTDFGLTKRTSAKTAFTATGQFVGTLDYVAPEQIRGEDLDRRADVYALGCVLYECLTGARPYRRDSEIAVIYAHLEEPPPRPSERGLPAALDEVVARALAKHPADRFESCAAMLTQARIALEEPATEVPEPPTRAAVPVPPTSPAASPAQPAAAASPAPPAAPPTAAASPPSSSAPGRRGPATASTRALPLMRRRGPALAVAGVAAAVLVAAVLALTGGSDTTPVTATDTNTATDADSGDSATDTRRPSAPPIEVGGEPAGVAIRAGSVWVSNAADGTVSRIDERRRRVTATVDVGEGPEGISAGHGAVWVANRGSGNVSRLDPESGDPLGPAIPVGEGPRALAIGVGDGSVWVANSGQGSVSRIDVAGAAADPPIEVGAQPRAIGTTQSSVWVANAGDGTLTRIDVETRSADEPVPAGDEPVALAIRDGLLWVANAGDGTVSRLDNRSGEAVSDPVRVGGRPSAVWVGERYAWVADEQAGVVQRINPRSGRLVGRPFRVGDGPVALRTDGRVCWVVSRRDGSVTPLEV